MGNHQKSTEQIFAAKQCLGQLGKNDVDDRLAAEFMNIVDKSAQRARAWLTDKGIQITNVREFFETTFPNITTQLEEAVTAGQRSTMANILVHAPTMSPEGVTTMDEAFQDPIQPFSEKKGYKPLNRYSDPHPEKSTPLRSDLPDLLGDGMIMNPGFSQVSSTQIQKAYDLIEDANQFQTKKSFHNAYRQCEKCIPEFTTQFSEEQQRQMLRGDKNGLGQMSYAFTRLHKALCNEEELEHLTKLLHSFLPEETLNLIQDERIRARIHEAIGIWDAMVRTPYRNPYLHYPMKLVDQSTFDSKLFGMGKKLAQKGPEYFGCIFDPNHNERQGAFGKSSRCLFLFNEQLPFCMGTTLIHELIHVCQSNDRLRRSYEEWEKSVDGWQNLDEEKYPNPYNIATEAEANWIEANIYSVFCKTMGKDPDDFYEEKWIDADHRQHMNALIGLYEKHKTETTGSDVFPTGFKNDWALYMSQLKSTFVEENQEGVFQGFHPQPR